MGPLLRFLLILIALWLLFRFIKKLVTPAPPPPQRRLGPTDTVACAHCGTYIPQPDAIMRNGKAYCSQQHLEARER